jgi:hypothetical protein
MHRSCTRDVTVSDEAGPPNSRGAGSLERPVVADAAGGNERFAQLVCLIGDSPPCYRPRRHRFRLVEMLAWLTNRYDVNTSLGATTTFVSRGPNPCPAGETVTAATSSVIVT